MLGGLFHAHSRALIEDASDNTKDAMDDAAKYVFAPTRERETQRDRKTEEEIERRKGLRCGLGLERGKEVWLGAWREVWLERSGWRGLACGLWLVESSGSWLVERSRFVDGER